MMYFPSALFKMGPCCLHCVIEINQVLVDMIPSNRGFDCSAAKQLFLAISIFDNNPDVK